MDRILEILKNNARLYDYYLVGPIQRAAVEDFAISIVEACAETLDAMPNYYKSEKAREIERETIFDCVRTLHEQFGVDRDR